MGTALGQALGVDLGADLGADLCPRGPATPQSILSGNQRKGWWRADEGVTLNGSRVSGWTNRFSNGNIIQNTAGAQPLYSATGVAGKPAVENDDGARMMRVAALTSGVPVNTRSYLWAYVKLSTAPTGTQYLASLSNASSSPRINAVVGVTGVWRILNNAISVFTAIATDTSVHLIEAGLTADGASQVVVSGVGADGAAPGVVNAVQSTVAVFGNGNTSAVAGAVGLVAEIVVIQGLPTAKQLTDMRAYFLGRYGSI